jgi:hypothetical protein
MYKYMQNESLYTSIGRRAFLADFLWLVRFSHLGVVFPQGCANPHFSMSDSGRRRHGSWLRFISASRRAYRRTPFSLTLCAASWISRLPLMSGRCAPAA